MPPIWRSQNEAHKIHRGKGQEAKFHEGTIDGDTNPQFCHGTGGKHSPVPCTRDSAHKTFGPTDLTSTSSVCTQRLFGSIGHRAQAFRSGVRCSNHQATHGFTEIL
ncbi:hypothetical protein TNCV_2989461 [Trichonephila clavipes]|nr:hypothetical protein TNCV_2989461 [Trichonephila clavipes]